MEKLERNLDRIPVPEVQFELPSPEQEAGRLTWFCCKKIGNIDWSDVVYKHHPKLKERTEGVSNQDEFYALCLEYVKKYTEEHKSEIEKSAGDFQKSWDEIGETFLAGLSTDFETSLPEEIVKIKAGVSINPICPRDVHNWSFELFYKFSNEGMKKTAIHEIIHFLYFKKWAEVFPDCDKKEFDNPHPVWKLSEILVVSIMNANKKIQEILEGQKSFVYREWQKVRIGDQNLSDYFETFYREHLESEGKISFADFLKKCWEEYCIHQESIEEGMVG
jgi:hypothetical protein